MSRLIQKGKSADVDRQRRELAQWLYEWQLDQAMAANPERDAPTGGVFASCNAASPRVAASPRHRGRRVALQVGDVRLLSPVVESTWLRPVYVLLLAQGGDGFWLVAPFGRFGVPAVPGEWRTGSRSLHARVLCCWQVRRIEPALLADAWRVMRFPKAKLTTALRVAAACCDRSELDTQALPIPWAALGPPLRHPADPRRDYLAQESDRLDDLGSRLPMRSTFAFDGQLDGGRESLRYPTPSHDDLLMAAEKRADPYGKGKKST